MEQLGILIAQMKSDFIGDTLLLGIYDRILKLMDGWLGGVTVLDNQEINGDLRGTQKLKLLEQKCWKKILNF